MCQNGVNNDQLLTMVQMTDDSVRLNQQWVKELAHLAGHLDLKSTAALGEAAKKLREVGATLAETIDELESGVEAPGVEVVLV